MTPAVKGGLALTVPAAAGAYPLYRFLTIEEEVWPVALFELDATDVTNYSGKFGEEYGKYMKHPTDEKNKEWWEYSLEKIANGDRTVKGAFSNSATGNDAKEIGKGFGTDDKALSKICDDIYKIETSKVDSTGGDGKYKEELVWNHCSVFKKKPKTVEIAGEVGEYNGTGSNSKLGKEKKDKLVAIKDDSGFWHFQEIRFKKRDLNSFASGDSPFKKVREGKSAKKKVKELCLEEYKKETTAISSYKDDFWKFCSLTGKES